MQKKLLTLAVAGALGAPGLALAQSSVEVYGTINMSFGNFKFGSSTSGASSLSKWDVANHASNYGVRGRESVGGGMTAWFQIESNAPLERSNNIAITPASRNSAVGVQGDFGNVFIGQWTSPWADLDSLWSIGTVGGWGPVTSIIGRRETTGTAPNPNCVNDRSGGVNQNGGTPTGQNACDAIEGAGGVGHPFWRRLSNAAFYQSPVFNGIQVKVAYQTNEGRAIAGAQPATANNIASVRGNPSLWSTSVQWTGMGGNARVGASYDRHTEFTTVNLTDTGYAVKGGYNFGVVDLGLAMEKMTYKTVLGNCTGSNYGIALAFPVATGAIRGSWSKAGDLNDPGCGAAGAPIAPAGSTVGNNGATEMNLGYEHRFSKRTQVGVGYATIRNDPQGAHNWTGVPPNQGGSVNGPLAGSSMRTIFVNMVHRF
jgi:predicted porin